MMLIDAILTIPGIMVEAEYQRRIVFAFCDVEEGAPIRPLQSRKCLAAEAMILVQAEKQDFSREGEEVVALRQAIGSVHIVSQNE